MNDDSFSTLGLTETYYVEFSPAKLQGLIRKGLVESIPQMAFVAFCNSTPWTIIYLHNT